MCRYLINLFNKQIKNKNKIIFVDPEKEKKLHNHQICLFKSIYKKNNIQFVI